MTESKSAQSLFKEILEEASKRVARWPDWKKSNALRVSEVDLKKHLLKCKKKS